MGHPVDKNLGSFPKAGLPEENLDLPHDEQKFPTNLISLPNFERFFFLLSLVPNFRRKKKRKSPFFWQFLTQIDAHLPHFQKYRILEKVGIPKNFRYKNGGGRGFRPIMEYFKSLEFEFLSKTWVTQG